jgi:hypothetical protein
MVRATIVTVLLILLAPAARPASARNCMAEASARLAPGSSLVLVYRDGMALPARLVAADTVQRALHVTTGEGDSLRALSVTCRELSEIRYRAAGKVKAGWMVLGIVGGAIIGGLVGNSTDPPDNGDFLDFGGGPTGAAVGAGVGFLLGTVIPASIPSTRRIPILDEPSPEVSPAVALDGSPAAGEPAAAAVSMSRPAGTTWRGSAPPGCRDFILTEAGASVSLSGDLPDAGAALTWDLGYMHNLGSRSAVGGSFYLRAYSFEWFTVGFRPRYRHWLGRRTGLDIGPGLVLSSGGDFGGFDQAPPLAFGSLNASLALTYGDLVAVTLEFDALRFEESSTPAGWPPGYYFPGGVEGGTHSAWYAGARFGGWLGPVATGALLGVAMIAFASDPM